MIIQLPKPTTIILVPAVTAITDFVDKLETIDDGTSVSVSIYFPIQLKTLIIVLWDTNTTPSYSDIDNWTDAQVNDRIIELLNY